MFTTLKRPYSEIETRIRTLKEATRRTLGVVKGESGDLPIDLLIFPPEQKDNPDDRIRIFLSGGAHGDEPAGMYALLDWLEHHAYGYEKKFRFYVIPTLNPSGIEKNQANSLRRDNINRQFFEQSHCPETQIVQKALRDLSLQFRFSIDMHEIPPYWADEGWTTKDNPLAVYLYEIQADPKLRMGRAMIDQLPKDIEVCLWPSIYGDKANRGVVSYPEGNSNAVYAQGKTMDAFMNRLYTRHSFTTETPIGWPLEKRVRAHLSMLKSALDAAAK